jgi:hypothetical protein
VFSIDLNIGDVVLEDGWDVDLSVEAISLYPSFFFCGSWKPSQIREGGWNQEQLRICKKSDGGRGFHTSGKVPLEKTLEIEGISCLYGLRQSAGE